MEWQEAVEKSPYKIATRRDEHGNVMRRDLSGEVLVYNTDGYIQIVEAMMVEGFKDWEPLA